MLFVKECCQSLGGVVNGKGVESVVLHWEGSGWSVVLRWLGVLWRGRKVFRSCVAVERSVIGKKH